MRGPRSLLVIAEVQQRFREVLVMLLQRRSVGEAPRAGHEGGTLVLDGSLAELECAGQVAALPMELGQAIEDQPGVTLVTRHLGRRDDGLLVDVQPVRVGFLRACLSAKVCGSEPKRANACPEMEPRAGQDL